MSIPDRKISETILEFGKPLLSQLDEAPPIEVMRNVLQIVITVWNAHVMAMPIWSHPERLQQLKDVVYGGAAPSQMMDVFEDLSIQRMQKFANDPRAVGLWNTLPDGVGGYRFRCDARLPSGVVAPDEDI